MKSAFNQIPLHFADRHKTAFSTPDGDKYQFNRLCFGLKNSPKAFQSIAQEVLGDLLHHGALVYIDDIILFTKTIDEHFELLGRKFKVFTDHKPLAGFLSNKNPSSKILRWKLALEEFNYDIHYIRGSLNSVADNLSRYINNITIALPDSKDLINMQREDSVLSTIIQKLIKMMLAHKSATILLMGKVCYVICPSAPRDHPGLTPLESRVMGIQKRHISSYSAHVNGRVEKPNQSLANILASISQNTNDWDEQLPHTMLALNSAIHEATYTSPFFLEHGRDIRLSYTYEKNSDTPQNKYEYVEKLLPSLEHTFNKVLNNLKDQEASHVELSTRATKQHHYDYKIGSLCFIKTPNIKSNLSPKLRPKFEGPYRVIERFSNVNYRVQHVEQLRKRFNTHVNRMIPFIKRFSYLHLKNLGDLQPDKTEVKGIVPGPRKGISGSASHPTEKGDAFPRLEEGNVPINTSWFGMFFGNFPRLGDNAIPKPTVYTRVITDETAQRGEPMVRVSLTNLKNPRRHFRIRCYGTQSKGSLTRGHSLVVEHSTADREVPGSNLGAPFFREVKREKYFSENFEGGIRGPQATGIPTRVRKIVRSFKDPKEDTQGIFDSRLATPLQVSINVRLMKEKRKRILPAFQVWNVIVQQIQTRRTATAGSDVVQSGRQVFDDFFQHLWPYIGNNTANVVFQMIKRLWLIRLDQ
ncbi:integrase catalytic domain-containing protein [Trichonephila clavipes]|nr:integrase catalytic domain-containing protein [Trichonephila clavipes]